LTKKVSPSLEDYLEAILNLTNKEEKAVRITDLAYKLGVSKASAHVAVSQLNEMGLVKKEHYGPLELTKKGCKAAEQVQKKHETLRYFFTEVLGVEEKTAMRDACAVEHYLSKETAEKLIAFVQDYITHKNGGVANV